MKASLANLLTVLTRYSFVHEFVDFRAFLQALTGHPDETADIERLASNATPHLLNQLPFLVEAVEYVESKGFLIESEANALAVLHHLENLYGVEFDIEPMPSGSILSLSTAEAFSFVDPEFGEAQNFQVLLEDFH